MKNKILPFAAIAAVLLVLLSANSAYATKLTFDATPGFTAWTDIGSTNFATVYGDHGSIGSDGKTYSYDGVAADTPNIGVNYGNARVSDGMYWDAKAKFGDSGYGSLTNVIYASATNVWQVTEFAPDATYATVINSVDVASYSGTSRPTTVEVWESIGGALDGIIGSTEYPTLTAGTHYKVIYSDANDVTTGTTFNVNVGSGKIVWLVMKSDSSSFSCVDNVDFDQELIDTCAEVHLYGMAEDADLVEDCIVNLEDFAVLAGDWLLNYDPHEVLGFGSKDELLIDGAAKLPLGVYGIYPGMAGQSVSALVTDEQWANQAGILDTQASGGDRVQVALDEALGSHARVSVYPFPRDVSDRVVSGAAGSSLATVDADMITEWVNKFKGHPGLLGWYLVDEPEGGGKPTPVSWYEEAYQHIKSIDQYNHPVIITNNSVAGVTDYSNAADVMLPDPYPRPLKSTGGAENGGTLVDYVTPFIDAAVAAGKPVWLTPQLFDYALFAEAQSDTRAPTFEELRGMIYGAVVHGAKGVIGFSDSYYRVEPETRIGYKYIGRELRKVRDPILLGTTMTSSASDGDIDTLSVSYNGTLVTIAVNTSLSAKTGATVTQTQAGGTLFVLSEGRTETPVAGVITDDFAANGVHIYMSKDILAEVLTDIRAEIDADIAAVVADNTGNIAYDPNDTSSVVVDSEHYRGRLALTDGYYTAATTGGAVYSFESDGVTSTDYIEVTLPSAKTVDWVGVYSESPYYPAQRFEDYTIEVYSTASGWLTVKDVDKAVSPNTQIIMKADETDFDAIGNPADITKVKFTGDPNGFRAINEIRIWE